MPDQFHAWPVSCLVTDVFEVGLRTFMEMQTMEVGNRLKKTRHAVHSTTAMSSGTIVPSETMQHVSVKHVAWVLSKSKNDLIAASFALGVSVNTLRDWMAKQQQEDM